MACLLVTAGQKSAEPEEPPSGCRPSGKSCLGGQRRRSKGTVAVRCPGCTMALKCWARQGTQGLGCVRPRPSCRDLRVSVSRTASVSRDTCIGGGSTVGEGTVIEVRAPAGGRWLLTNL